MHIEFTSVQCVRLNISTWQNDKLPSIIESNNFGSDAEGKLVDKQTFQSYIRHFRPKLGQWNERVYFTLINRAIKIWFNKGSGSFLRPTIPKLWKILQNEVCCFLDKINTQISEILNNFFITKQVFFASKKYKKIQFWVKWLYNIYLTKAKIRTLSLFTKNII